MRPVTDRGIVMGASAGGHAALAGILSRLPPELALPILVVQHLHAGDEGAFASNLQRETRLRVQTPHDKQPIEPGLVLVAPANYHMLCERAGVVSLTIDDRVRWSRPSIDVLFDSAARAWGRGTIAVLLSGANDDGAAGLRMVRLAGGRTIVQAPETAECPIMPRAAIEQGVADEVLDLAGIAARLTQLGGADG